MPGRQWTVSSVASQSQENFQPCGKRKRKFTFDWSFDGFGKPATSSTLVSEVHMATAGAERTTRTKKRMRRLLPALRQPTRERDPPGRPAALTPCCVRPPRAELARGPWSWRQVVPPLLPLCAPHSPSPVPPPPPRASETAGPTSPAFPPSFCRSTYSLGSTNPHGLSFPNDTPANSQTYLYLFLFSLNFKPAV